MFATFTVYDRKIGTSGESKDVIVMPGTAEQVLVVFMPPKILVKINCQVSSSQHSRIRFQLRRFPEVAGVNLDGLGYRLALKPGAECSAALIEGVRAAVVRVLNDEDIPEDARGMVVTMNPIGSAAARLWEVTSSLPLPMKAVDALAAHFGIAGAPCAYMVPDNLSVVVHVRPGDWHDVDLDHAAREVLLQLFATTVPATAFR
jgi:hypothetical protein